MAKLINQTKKIDRILFFLSIGLTFFGLLMVYDASLVSAFRDFGDKYFYVRQQSLWALLGLGVLFFFSRLDYHYLTKVAKFSMLAVTLLLVLVLVPSVGTQALGARRWLSLGGFSFQPSEIAKPVYILYLAYLFRQKAKLAPFVGISAILVFLVMLQPDLGTTAIILLSGFALYFASGASLASLLPVGVVGVISGILLILSSPYRKERLLTFLDLGRDPLGASYHIRQVLIALGSGGLFGLGLGASRQKYEYLPEAMTDSIFAIFAEEVGFVGSVVLILAFLLLIWRGLKIAREAPDIFGQLLAVGIVSLVGVQAFLNLAAMVALVPLTGVPLPFVSYGGSSLVVTLAGIGILLSISKYRVKKKRS